MSKDPLKNAELHKGTNIYAYTGSNPVKRTDQLGLDWSDYVPIVRLYNQLQPQPRAACSDYTTPYPVNTDDPVKQQLNEDAINTQLAGYEGQQILPAAVGDIVDVGGAAVSLATSTVDGPIGVVGATVLVGEGLLSTALTLINIFKIGEGANQAKTGCGCP